MASESDMAALKIAVEHQLAGRLPQAEAIYRQLLEREPANLVALQNYSVIACAGGRNELAVDLLRRVLAIDPSRPQFHNNLGAVLGLMRRFDEAIEVLQRAVRRFPEEIDLQKNLGRALTDACRAAEALPWCRKVAEQLPGDCDAQVNLGLTFVAHGSYEDAVARFRQAIALDRGNTRAHCNLAITLLLLGHFDEGWREYEWIAKELNNQPMAPMPAWDGRPMPGRSLLVYTGQGFGDSIQFARYLPLLSRYCGRIIFKCQPQVIPILKHIPGVSQVMANEDTLPMFDAHCRLMSLPRMFGTREDRIPASIPYIHADPVKAARWEKRMESGKRIKVGLVWAGRSEHLNDRNRSASLEALAPLAQVADATFYSLQLGEPAKQAQQPPAGMQLVDLSEELRDFADTAAVIANLDVLISVDTAVVHLAGAMGKPVWTLLAFVPDWRWQVGRSDSPWYPTMRLFRQKAIGDWSEPVKEAASALGELAASKTAQLAT